MIDVAQTIGRDAQLLAVVEAHNGTMRIDGFDCSEIAIGNAECPVGCAELYAVASCEDSMFLAKDFDAEQPDRIVLDAPPVRPVLTVSTLASRSTASTRA